MRFALDHPRALLLLAAVPALALLMRYGGRQRKAALTRFSSATPAVDGRQRRKKQGLVLLGILALVLAVARPVWKADSVEAPARRTGDVVFLLDVSRSMLAEDAAPNRLAVAKRLIAELAAQMKRERVALVTFAGNSAVQCPLTVDYAYFRERLGAPHPIR